MATHEVTNQVPPRVGLDEFEVNIPLREAVLEYGADWAVPHLHRAGRHVGKAQFQRDAQRANTHEPVLHTHDRYGNRIDEVEYDDAYHRVLGAAVGFGAHTSAWAHPGPGANVARAATFMLFAQPNGPQGNVVSKGVNELIIPNYKQTWGAIRKIANRPGNVAHLSFKSQEYQA